VGVSFSRTFFFFAFPQIPMCLLTKN
jgi:hypothetical protein